MQAMKLMNEIEAEVSGTVVKWVAEDAGTIDPGDVICIIDPKA
jgi:biotin carboxyl carrier protein